MLNRITRRSWLLAGAALALAGCQSMGGGSAATQWPTMKDVKADAGFSADGLAALDARMKEMVDKGQVAGVEYLVIKDGKLGAFKIHGNQSVGGAPMTENTIFRIRSMSKPITGVAMMQLYEQGKWKPEDPITKWYPEYANLKVAPNRDNLDGLVPASHVPTMRELFTHTAGFGYGLNNSTAVDRAYIEKSPMGEKDMAAMVKRTVEIPLLNQPGTRWSYSIAIDIQGAIIEKISGEKFGDYLENHIFKPLGMNDSGFWLEEKDKARFATVYQFNNDTKKLDEYPDASNRSFFVKDHEESGGGGLTSTTHDYARFVQMLLNKGTLDGKQILKKETVELMFQNQMPPGAQGRPWGYGGSLSGPPSDRSPQGENTFSWFGIDGTWFWADHKNGVGFVGMIQRRGGGGPGAVNTQGDSASLVYKAIQK